MVKVGGLWKDIKFQVLDDCSKLLYIYLAANPNITTLGVALLNLDIMCLEMGKTLPELRKAAISLRDSDFIRTHKTDSGVYFVVLGHFMSLPKSELITKKARKELEGHISPIQDILNEFIDIDAKFITFQEPTQQEVIDFAMQCGYSIDAKEFIRFYRDNAANLGKSGWFDGRGKIVKSWKGKLTQVWFKEDRKLKKCEDAPKGFEYFHTVIDGKVVSPDYWRDGKPISKGGLIINKKLQQEYVRKTGS